ncbi:hypothetical protein [Hymenobacter fodinae]|uniref:hypothetical protein n=1 Tax=Hymenobacter fodinae TaxID=2510796 RepID=UPI001436B2CA|nr:hypothetical protein [Hymenobacter fodinae]
MEQKAPPTDYIRPLAINALLILNIFGAMALAISHQRDGYLGGLGYVLYAGLSILGSTVFNLAAFLWALTKHNTWGKIIYAVAALSFFVLSVLVLREFDQIGSLKPGG